MNNRKQKKFVVFDNDEAYAVRLSSFFEKQNMFSFETVCFTKADALRKLAENRDEEILVLASESALPALERELKPSLNHKNLIVLSESGETFGEYESELESKYESVYKYQTGDAIYRNVMKILSEKPVEYDTLPAKKSKMKDSNHEIYAFFSPADSVLQSMFAMSLGRQMAKSGKKVIYLNMGSFNAFGSGKSPEIDILDLMSYTESSAENFKYRLGSAVQKIGGLHVISQAFSYLDVLQIENERWERLIELLLALGGYDLMILDLSVTIRSLPQILYGADYCISVFLDSTYAISQQEHFEQLMTELGFGAVIEKLERVKLEAKEINTQSFGLIDENEVNHMAEKYYKSKA